MALSNESKVGLLVVVALMGLGWLTVRTGAFSSLFGESSRTLDTTFTDVEGISVGSGVKMAGVAVGEISNLELQPNGTAKVTFTVKKNVKLPADVSAQIATSGLIGERFLALIPGAKGAEGQGGLLPENAHTVPSTAPVGVENIAGNFAKVGSDLEAVTGTLRKVFGDPSSTEKLQTIIDGFATLSGNLQNNSGDIVNNVNRTASNLAMITDRLAKGQGPLGQLLMADGKGGGNMMSDLQGALKDLKETMAKINSGQGTIGKLVNDPATADKLNGALDTLTQVSDRVEQFRTEVSMEGYSLTNESGVGKGNLALTLQPRPTRFYALGITSDGFAGNSSNKDYSNSNYYGKDFGKSTKFTAQFGQVYQNALMGRDVDVRIGLKDSTAGVGADTRVPVPYTNKTAKLSADIYDFSGSHTPGSKNPHVDLKAKVDVIGNSVYAVGGYDNLLSSQYGSPFVGMGVKFQDDDLKYILGKQL